MDERPGYLIPEPKATLVLDDEYKGAEIEARLTLSPRLYFAGMDLLARMGGQGTTKAGLVGVADELARFFAEYGLVSWNLLDPRSGEPLPATTEGAQTLDVRLLASIFSTWIQWLGNVPLPLPESSPEPITPVRLNKRRRSSTAGASTGATPSKRSRSRTSPPSSVSAA